MDLLLIVLGALLAVAGGFVTQRPQAHLDRLSKEENLLIEVKGCIRKILRIRAEIAGLPHKSYVASIKFSLDALEEAIANEYVGIQRAAIQLTSDQHRAIAVKLLNASKSQNSAEEAGQLKQMIQEINPKLMCDIERR